MSTDRLRVQAFLERAGRRRATLLALAGASAAVAGALALLGAGWLGLFSWRAAMLGGAACITAGALDGLWRARRARPRIAYDVERRAPACRNLLVTAAELMSVSGPSDENAGSFDENAASSDGNAGAAIRPASTDRPDAPAPTLPRRQRAKPAIVRLVESRAAELIGGLDTTTLFPLRRTAAALLVGLAIWGGLAAVARARPLDAAAPAPVPAPASRVADAVPAIAAVEIVVTPPAYTGQPPSRLVDPTRLRVVAGSRLEVDVQATGSTVMLSTLEGSRELLRQGERGFRTELIAEADGFLALEPRAGERAGRRRLIGLVVVPDALPRVRLTEPGLDLFLPQPEVDIPIVATAQDDFGLETLRLTYTIVSGSGETFEFTEGELPARLTRDDDLSWSAAANLAPAALGLSLGDMLVYRAVARDRRPGAPEVESDAFVVEIVAPDAAIAGGFALESDEPREALSQRMVIIKTERLLAAKQSMSVEDYAYEALRIAAEQRMVRAEFVFMMGGEIQDEVEEAEHEHEVASGRLELRGRQEMSRAVLLMSQAAAQLTQADLEAALPLEQAALEALQSALARSRYILRTMSERESIDLTRRLSGTPGAARGARAAEEMVADPQLAGLRRLLADIAAVAAQGEIDDDASGRLAELAEAVLRLDPSSEVLQEAAGDLAGAADGAADAPERLARVVEALTARIEAGLPLAPAAGDADPSLAGALADELNARGGGR
jgi:hypothetical protein